eukprot:sb/3470447/
MTCGWSITELLHLNQTEIEDNLFTIFSLYVILVDIPFVVPTMISVALTLAVLVKILWKRQNVVNSIRKENYTVQEKTFEIATEALSSYPRESPDKNTDKGEYDCANAGNYEYLALRLPVVLLCLYHSLFDGVSDSIHSKPSRNCAVRVHTQQLSYSHLPCFYNKPLYCILEGYQKPGQEKTANTTRNYGWFETYSFDAGQASSIT